MIVVTKLWKINGEAGKSLGFLLKGSVFSLVSRPGLANREHRGHSWWAGLVFGCSVMVLG